MKKFICITIIPIAFALTCRIMPNNPADQNSKDYRLPYLIFNENSLEDGDTIATEEAVWNFFGNLGVKNYYRYKFNSKNWVEWYKVKSNGTEVRLILTRADTGMHTVTFQTCYHPDDDITDTSFSFVKINAPLIIHQPEDETETEGNPVSFSVIANGTNLFYQWQKDTVNIEGATSPVFSIPAVAASDNNSSYRCIIYNIGGLTATNYVKLTVNKKIIPPLITIQPENKTVTEGQAVMLAVAAVGTDVVYQWQKGSTTINGATSAIYTLQNVLLSDSGSEYCCIVSNAMDTVVSNKVTLTVTQNIVAPSITGQPVSDTVIEGRAATFHVIATGTNLKYQWQKGNTDITGANASTYSVPPVASTDNAASYRCVVSNTADTIISNSATLTIGYTLTYLGNGNGAGAVPIDTGIYLQNGVIAVKGNEGSLTRTGYIFSGWTSIQNGSGKAYLQNDTLIAGLTNIQLFAKWSIDSITVSFNSNEGSSVSSQIISYGGYATEPAAPAKTGFAFAGWFAEQALVTLFDFSTPVTAPRILYAKWNTVYRVIYNVNGGSGAAPVDTNLYQSGEFVSVLDKPFEMVRQNHVFAGWNTKNDGTGATRLVGTSFQTGSKNDTLFAKWQIAKPLITLQPSAITVFPLDSISFSVTAEGIGITYQWQKDDYKLPEATNSVYSKQKVSFTDSGYYCCVVSNESGKTTSSSVKLTIRTTVKDADSNEYSIVVIGNQVWTAENLRTTKCNDGTSIPLVIIDSVWENLKTPGHCFYSNTAVISEQKKWGALYNWFAVNTGKLAPNGWRVPDAGDWMALENWIWEKYGSAKSLAANVEWATTSAADAVGNNLATNNSTGFSALPSGFRFNSGGYFYQGNGCTWWCTTESDSISALLCGMTYSNTGLRHVGDSKECGYSVRLIKD
jgi:uncharacterized protein (TIGR02145 family)/uncharacterized repeat protein (TIGR02543 family)